MTGLLLLANLAPDLPKVISWIDPGTMGLLFGMMIIVGQLQGTGVFEVICAWGLQVRGARGRGGRDSVRGQAQGLGSGARLEG